MKKVGAIGFAAFYLLLTTGLFVCVLHCSSTYLFQRNPFSTITHNGENKHHKTKDCCNGTDSNDCCKKHGEYIIKENSTPYKQTIDGPPLSFLISHKRTFIYAITAAQAEIQVWSMDTGPPEAGKMPIYLVNQTLLI